MALHAQQTIEAGQPALTDEAAPAGPDMGLESLAGQAQQLQAGAATDADVAGIPQPEEKPAISNAQAVTGIVKAVRASVCMLAGLEAPKRTMTDDKAEQLGAIWGEVLDHYGIQLSSHMGKFGVLIPAALSSFPLIEETWIETRKEIAAKDAKRPQQLAAPDAPATLPPAPAPASNSERNPAASRQDGIIRPSFAGAS